MRGDRCKGTDGGRNGTATDTAEHNAVKWSGAKIFVRICWHLRYVGSVGSQIQKRSGAASSSSSSCLAKSAEQQEARKCAVDRPQSYSTPAASGRPGPGEDLN